MDNINWRLLIVIYILLAGVWGTLIKVASDRLNPLTMSFIVATSSWLAVAPKQLAGVVLGLVSIYLLTS